jgi:hypothetical protein
MRAWLAGVSFILRVVMGAAVLCGVASGTLAQDHVAGSTDQTKAAATPAVQKPVDVHVGIYVIQLGDPDLKTSDFKAVFWVWFRWKGSPDLDPMKKFEVVGGAN